MKKQFVKNEKPFPLQQDITASITLLQSIPSLPPEMGIEYLNRVIDYLSRLSNTMERQVAENYQDTEALRATRLAMGDTEERNLFSDWRTRAGM